MRNFRFMAILTTLSTYFLIFIGGLVRVSGAGLGCPDWPKCFGSWIPPFSVRQLPPEIDPNTFNLSLAWIEYINRLAGMTVGLLILALAIWAIIKYRKYPKILIPSLIVAPLTAFQGWQGSVVVSSELEPLIISVHMVIALMIVSLLIYISLQAYYYDIKLSAHENSYQAGIKTWAGILWLLAIIEVILGTQLRQAFESAAELNPLMSSSELLKIIGSIKFIHPLVGLFAALFMIYLISRLLSRKYQPSYLIWQCSWCLSGLLIIQIALGIIMMSAGLHAISQVMHLWTASLLSGVLFIIYFSLRQKGEVE